jgi:N-formylglutamate deformylase
MNYPILIHLPHSSMFIPEEDKCYIIADEQKLNNELLKLTDRYTDELFEFEGAVVQKNYVSRFIMDPERFRDDKVEEMSKFGMGAIYTHATDGMKIKEISTEKHEQLLRKLYDPYHLELEQKVQGLLDKYGKCIIVDGHSFPEKPLDFEPDKNPDRPDICIGTSNFHTPEELTKRIELYVSKNGKSVKRNFPFAGTMVPMKYYNKDARVLSVMIEVNRRLYMDEATGEKSTNFDWTRDFIKGLLTQI